MESILKKRSDGLIDINNSEMWPKEKDPKMRTRIEAIGVGKKADPKSLAARLQVKFKDHFPVWGNYDILYTDYENMAVVHGCLSLGIWKKDMDWVLTREPIIPTVE